MGQAEATGMISWMLRIGKKRGQAKKWKDSCVETLLVPERRVTWTASRVFLVSARELGGRMSKQVEEI